MQESLDVLHVLRLCGQYSGAWNGSPKLLVMADHLLGEIKDEYRFDIDYFKT
jgi:hypothetical protein